MIWQYNLRLELNALGYNESAISLRLWIYRIENLSLVCLLLQCTTQKSANMALWPKEVPRNTKTWKQKGKLRHSSQVTSEITDVLEQVGMTTTCRVLAFKSCDV